MKKYLFIIGLLPFVLFASAQDDMSTLARAKTKQLADEGWKVHAGAKPLYDQVYGAVAFEKLYETDNPMNVLYTGRGMGEYDCVKSMLVAFAENDIRDWYKDFTHYATNLEEHGLATYKMAARLIYPEYRVLVLDIWQAKDLTDRTPDKKHDSRIENIDDSFLSNWRQIIQPFVQVYRIVDGKREDMIIGRFTDDFLADRRVPAPVYEGYKTPWPEDAKSYTPDDFPTKDLIQEANLYTTKTGIKETTISGNSSESEYKSQSVYRILVNEERLKLVAELEYKVEEKSN